MAYMEAEFTWDLGGSETDGGKGVMTSKAVAYNTAGPQTATVSVKNGMDTKTYTCSALQVNSEKPTCTCTAAGGDLQKGSTATWTAVCDNSNVKYIWNGTAGEKNTFEATYTAADVGNKLTPPTLGVEMVDGSKFDGADGFTCDEVKVTDGPEYKFEIKTDDQGNSNLPQGEIDVEDGGCMAIVGTWTNTGYSPNVQVLCSGTSDDQSVGMTFKMTFGGKTIAEYSKETTGWQGWGFSNQGGAIGQVSVGDVSYDNICVTFTGAKTVKCKVQ